MSEKSRRVNHCNNTDRGLEYLHSYENNVSNDRVAESTNLIQNIHNRLDSSVTILAKSWYLSFHLCHDALASFGLQEPDSTLRSTRPRIIVNTRWKTYKPTANPIAPMKNQVHGLCPIHMNTRVSDRCQVLLSRSVVNGANSVALMTPTVGEGSEGCSSK